MSDPLSRDEHRHAAVELELEHLARGRVQVAAQVAQQSTCQAGLTGAVAVAHAGGALDALVSAHVVDQRHETMVEYGKIETENLFGTRRHRTLAGHRAR